LHLVFGLAHSTAIDDSLLAFVPYQVKALIFARLSSIFLVLNSLPMIRGF
jgi:hypothetical protein